jgi:hypothetical protein
MLKEISWKQLLGMFEDETAKVIIQRSKSYVSTHVVVFMNNQMDSSRTGDRTAVCVGPNNTYKTLADCDGKWLNDLPSQRQYANFYAEIPQENTVEKEAQTFIHDEGVRGMKIGETREPYGVLKEIVSYVEDGKGYQACKFSSGTVVLLSGVKLGIK